MLMLDLTPEAILILASALIYLSGIAVGLMISWGESDEPRTEKEIAEQGRMRAAQTDVTYSHHTREVR